MGFSTAIRRDPASRVVATVDRLDRSVLDLVRDRCGGLGRGGMASKLEAARLATSAGENVIIAGGKSPDVLRRILAGEPVGTLFLAAGQTVAARKRWIGFSVKPRGRLLLDAGARDAVLAQGPQSPAHWRGGGEGRFHKGDVVAVAGPDGLEFARGLTNYGHEDLQKIKGLRTAQIAAALGHCPYDEILHRDNIVITVAASDM